MSRVVVVDDDPDVRGLVEYKLVKSGHEVTTFADGEEALRSMAAAGPEIVLLDVMMPGLSGLEVLTRLRADEATKDLPVIMLTAKAQAADVDLGLALGADDYVVKPFSPRELVARIDARLAHR